MYRVALCLSKKFSPEDGNIIQLSFFQEKSVKFGRSSRELYATRKFLKADPSPPLPLGGAILKQMSEGRGVQMDKKILSEKSLIWAHSRKIHSKKGQLCKNG